MKNMFDLKSVMKYIKWRDENRVFIFLGVIDMFLSLQYNLYYRYIK